MAGLGARLFPAFSKLTAAQVNGYLMDQSIMRFASAAVRDAAFGGAGEPTLAEGMTCYLDDTNEIQSYNGSAWVGVAASSSVANVSSGLVFIKSVTATSPATTIDVNNVFSSQYNAYRVIVGGGTATTIVTASLQFLDASGTVTPAGNYYEAFIYSTFSSSGTLTANTNNGNNFLRAAAAINGNDCLNGAFDILNPFLPKITNYQNASNSAGGNGGISIGYHNVASSYTGFRLTSSVVSGISGTVVSVYGYRI